MMIVIKIKTVYHLLILCAKCVPKLSKLVIPCENKKSQILVYQGFVIHRDCSTIIYYGDDGRLISLISVDIPSFLMITMHIPCTL